ncbi:hypothetical protein CJF32_00011057 [Rutstroemia sp. NJR-2017a WRK4]|nr:hypothetical protein CJF32_00011057 [Rutstroemia sp. NJR-2017a WRK4]
MFFPTIVAFTALITSTLAMPATLTTRQVGLCSAGTAQCCDVNVLGLADLDCETPPSVPTDIPDFNAICASVGKIDMCCDIPILEQGLICSSPSGS